MTFTGTLLPYQDEAVVKMIDRRKVLVAYDLGLGKTVLTIAAVEGIRDREPLGTVLVVCLSSLKYQWQKEIHKFSDSTAVVIDGTKKQRERQYAELVAGTTQYVIVNYEQVVNDWQALTLWEFDVLVLDEATAVKSFRAKRTKKVKELAKAIPNRFALTGTPIENGRPEELYSIMQAVDPDVLGRRFDLFDATFIVRNQWGSPERYRNLPILHERLKSASVRKSQTDPDVAPFLPDTIHRDPMLVPLDAWSARVYRHIAEQLSQELEEAQSLFGSSFNLFAHYGEGAVRGGPEDALRGSIMSKVTALKMLCDDPRLIQHSAAVYDPYVADRGSKFLAEMMQDDKVSSWVSRARSTKLATLLDLVADHLGSDDNKLVIFTSYVEMATFIQESLGHGVLYTGRMDARSKESAKVRFQTEPDVRVLISTDAGGYGVDLPQANLLINYDLPWSSGLAVQRNGRIRRASSKWPSIVIQDLLVADSVEERQHAVLQQKTAVAAAVLDGQGINERGGVDLTAGSLAAFLRSTTP